jgi:predicted  nucleic acid-binding Zn-ribbon protein
MTARRTKSTATTKGGALSPTAATKASASPKSAKSRRLDGDGAVSQLSVEQERDALRFELDTARERIAELEHRQAEIARRITAVLKSLHALKDDDA